jgi:hypothetical protein
LECQDDYFDVRLVNLKVNHIGFIAQ